MPASSIQKASRLISHLLINQARSSKSPNAITEAKRRYGALTKEFNGGQGYSGQAYSGQGAAMCLSIGLLTLCCGAVSWLLQNDGDHRPVNTGLAPQVRTNNAYAVIAQGEVVSANGPDADRDSFAAYFAERRRLVPPLRTQVVTLGRFTYCWRMDCPMRQFAVAHHPGWGLSSLAHYHFLTRAQAEAEHCVPCGHCLDLEAQEKCAQGQD